MPSDQNGNPVCRDVRREERGEIEGWGVTVTFGGGFGGFASTIRRYIYATRAQARDGDISDAPGDRGRIA